MTGNTPPIHRVRSKGLLATLVYAATEDDIEQLAEVVHEAYLAKCSELQLSVKQQNAVIYSELSEESKELDRATVRAVLGALAEMVANDE